MISIVYQDEEILVLEKPAGLVTTLSETSSKPSLEDILASDFGIKIERSGIVHRLDKDTSGLILVAKTMSALEALQTQFKDRIVSKEYLALVHGLVEEKGKVEAGIIRNPGNREKFIVVPPQPCQPRKVGPCEAREAVTEYKPISNFKFKISNWETIFLGFNKIQKRKLQRTHYGEFTLLKCFPKTGRTHQIRVHLKYLGFPIVGDAKYGGRKTVRLDRRWCPRQFLHASHLEFNHPRDGKRMEFDSKLPGDLKKTLEFLERI